MKKTTGLLVFLLVVSSVSAMEGQTKLLAVRETDNGTFEGSTADLFLEIRDGDGRVFLDTFPLTKTDTQISMRFAKEVSCNFLERDCSKYDFIYTIRADAPIIAGPSAGAAAAVLTSALLEGLEMKDDIAITGTINAGGLIGPVGGVKEKITAGAEAGMKNILIPEGERYVKEKRDETESINWSIKDGSLEIATINKTKDKEIDLVAYGSEINVSVKETSTLNDALFEATGRLIISNNKELELDSKYNEIMKKLAVDLCERSERLKDEIDDEIDGLEAGDNLTNRGEDAFEKGLYYSAASYCFGANVKYAYLILQLKNASLNESADSIRRNIGIIEGKLENKKKETITDIEAYAAVKERLIEANDFLKGIDHSEDKLYDLAYASERVYSAKAWYEFFIGMGKRFEISQELLKKSCQNKIAEAEERYQYVTLMYALELGDTLKDIDRAYLDLQNESYELCLFKASKAKAETGIILGLIGVNKDQMDNLIERKLSVVKQNIIKETEKDIFPIQSYSYYEYANVLKESDKYSALLYAEYSLELANLDMYFTPKENRFNREEVWIILLVVIFVLEIVFIRFSSKKKKKGKTKKRRGEPKKR